MPEAQFPLLGLVLPKFEHNPAPPLPLPPDRRLKPVRIFVLRTNITTALAGFFQAKKNLQPGGGLQASLPEK